MITNVLSTSAFGWRDFKVDFRDFDGCIVWFDNLPVHVFSRCDGACENVSFLLYFVSRLDFIVFKTAMLTFKRHQNYFFIEGDFCEQQFGDSLGSKHKFC